MSHIHNSSYTHSASYRKEFYKHLKNIDADGIITRNPSESVNFTKKGIPTIVAITESDVEEKIPKLMIDHKEIGQFAAKYFQEKGYRNFAFYGNTSYSWAFQRYEGFREQLSKSGYNVSCYKHPSSALIAKNGFEYKLNNLANWLKSLSMPTAMMACSDVFAVNVIESARIAGLHIPEQISLLGVDNDETICESCFPSLSSISLNAEISGFKMAELLDNMMNGQQFIGWEISIQPVQVITRTSTDIMAVADDDVAQALQFIRTNQRNLIQVVDVAEAVGVSLRTLQNKFRRELDRTILAEIKNTRISYAKELLLNSEMNISHISDYMNFTGINSFSRYFKTETGSSPLEYRKKYGKL